MVVEAVYEVIGAANLEPACSLLTDALRPRPGRDRFTSAGRWCYTGGGRPPAMAMARVHSPAVANGPPERLMIAPGWPAMALYAC